MKDQMPIQYQRSRPFCLDPAPRPNPTARSTLAQLLETEWFSRLTIAP